jgi:hypothetical protein
MFGWWSEDYLINNPNTPIYVYTTDSDSNTLVIMKTESIESKPDNLYNWKCIGQIYDCTNTISFNDLIGKNSTTNTLCQDEIIFESDINSSSDIYYGWYSEKFANRENNFITKRKINSVFEPKVHKYLTLSNSTVLVTHVTRNPNNKPNFPDTFFVGKVSKYLETVSFI